MKFKIKWLPASYLIKVFLTQIECLSFACPIYRKLKSFNRKNGWCFWLHVYLLLMEFCLACQVFKIKCFGVQDGTTNSANQSDFLVCRFQSPGQYCRKAYCVFLTPTLVDVNHHSTFVIVAATKHSTRSASFLQAFRTCCYDISPTLTHSHSIVRLIHFRYKMVAALRQWWLPGSVFAGRARRHRQV